MEPNEKVYYKDGVKYINLEENEKIFAEGSAGSEMYVIINGKIKIFLERGGEEFLLDTIGEGQFFGEMSLLEGEPRSADAAGATFAKLMVIDKNTFDKVMQKDTSLAFKIMKTLSGRLRTTNDKLMKLKKEFEEIIAESINLGEEKDDKKDNWSGDIRPRKR